MQATRASTQIPNLFLPIWTGQEGVQFRVAAEQALVNRAEGPLRLWQHQHIVQKTIIVSNPDGSTAQGASDVNTKMASGGVGNSILWAHALRAVADANVHELIVQCSTKSHVNDNMDAFLIDQSYDINYPRGGVKKKMYLYSVDYLCDGKTGPRTVLHFCNPGTIVAGASTKDAVKTLKAAGRLPLV
jgi:hypothetical protein